MIAWQIEVMYCESIDKERIMGTIKHEKSVVDFFIDFTVFFRFSPYRITVHTSARIRNNR